MIQNQFQNIINNFFKFKLPIKMFLQGNEHFFK